MVLVFKEENEKFNYILTSATCFRWFLFVSVGVFIINVPIGLIISGLLLFALAYMYSNKGGHT
ncbi:hypothetical protein LLT6_05360 [Lactococcus cremoris subsp. cremoris TIFN6]|uniref:Uncharacterized protein n=1 Tax=Lactococcus cremoris subsp. cremoris TIFN6 TaxID=1234876 RepID=T0SJ02_LACLC|nr:hypothetical protein LLT6_05360 [Lactococcus cremoris subsp. cremoris TIFN6]